MIAFVQIDQIVGAVGEEGPVAVGAGEPCGGIGGRDRFRLHRRRRTEGGVIERVEVFLRRPVCRIRRRPLREAHLRIAAGIRLDQRGIRSEALRRLQGPRQCSAPAPPRTDAGTVRCRGTARAGSSRRSSGRARGRSGQGGRTSDTPGSDGPPRRNPAAKPPFQHLVRPRPTEYIESESPGSRQPSCRPSLGHSGGATPRGRANKRRVRVTRRRFPCPRGRSVRCRSRRRAGAAPIGAGDKGVAT